MSSNKEKGFESNEAEDIEETENMVIPTTKEDLPSNKESYLSGLFTGMLALATTFLLVMLVMLIVFGKRLGFVDVNQSRYDNPQQLESVDNDIDSISLKIRYLAAVISSYYLNDVDENALVEGVFKGMVASLGDKYSNYLTKEEYEELTMTSSGNYVGIGCIVKVNDKDEIYIEEVLENGGAKEAGVEAGDIIVKIEGTAVSAENYEVTDQLKGKEGEKIRITVRKNTTGDEKDYTITRKSVEYKSVYSKELEDNIGYVSITGFEGNSPEQFAKAVDELRRKNIKGLIIDIRNNPGGTLGSVTGIADLILPKGLLVYTQDKNGKEIDRVETTNENFIDIPVVVLINEKSASASEVLAGAIKDRNAGKLVGKKTFGKGIVQTLLDLSDGSAIKLTTAKYFTPNGNYIHEKGIEPDFEVELDTEKYYDGEDTQLNKGVEVIKDMISSKANK